MDISIEKQDFSRVLDKDELNRLFDVDLRPLRSKNARAIYLLFLSYRDMSSLTTLDLQPMLENMNIILEKKEINAWLKSLHKAGLLTREDERGKPTTIEYHDRYTYDLWRLTPKGLRIADRLNKFMFKRTSLEDNEIIHEIPLRVEEPLKQPDSPPKIEPIHLTIMTNLEEANGTLSIDELKAELTPSWKTLEELVEAGVQRGYYEVEEGSVESSVDRFLRLLGIPRRSQKRVEMTDLGREIISGRR